MYIGTLLGTGNCTDTLGPTSILSLYSGPPCITHWKRSLMEVIGKVANPLSQFLYALKSAETKSQWPNRLRIVFEFLGLEGALDDQARQFLALSKEGHVALIQDRLIDFASYQIRTAQQGKYLKAIKLPYQTI
ncbi:MAG: hypothetical protein ACRD8Z_12410 [Nitrososphaeraceae archaeon]